MVERVRSTLEYFRTPETGFGILTLVAAKARGHGFHLDQIPTVKWYWEPVLVQVRDHGHQAVVLSSSCASSDITDAVMTSYSKHIDVGRKNCATPTAYDTVAVVCGNSVQRHKKKCCHESNSKQCLQCPKACRYAWPSYRARVICRGEDEVVTGSRSFVFCTVAHKNSPCSFPPFVPF